MSCFLGMKAQFVLVLDLVTGRWLDPPKVPKLTDCPEVVWNSPYDPPE